MNKIKALGAMALFAALLTGISGLAVAGSSGGSTQPITGNLTIPSTNTAVSCPQFAANLQTICTATVTGTASPTGTVVFSKTSPTGSFTGSSFCTLTSGSCSVTYADTAAGDPTVTASYSGDSLNAESVNSTSVVVNPDVCSISTGGITSLALSDGTIGTLNVTNVGNYNGAVTIQGSNWIGASTSLGSFSVSQTLWGLTTPLTALTLTPTSVISVLTNSTTPTPIHLRASAPEGTKAGTYHQTITLASSC